MTNFRVYLVFLELRFAVWPPSLVCVCAYVCVLVHARVCGVCTWHSTQQAIRRELNGAGTLLL